MTTKHLYATGMAVGLEYLDLDFMPDKPFAGCRICGRVYQSSLDRDHPHMHVPEHMRLSRDFEAQQRRKGWSIKHAKTHSEAEHRELAMSGAWCTPAAAQMLASFGVIALSDAVSNEEHEVALLESKAVPFNDVEGG
jgi:ABC-type uncharacterized transport system ATPase component